MATTMIPPFLAEALGHMQRPIACPEDVRVRIASLRVPVDDAPSARVVTNWRSGGPAAGGGGSQQYNNRYHGSGGGGGGGGWGNRGSGGGSYRSDHRNDQRNDQRSDQRSDQRNDQRPAGGAPVVRPPPGPRAVAPRFGNRARKDATVEERMLDRIRDKMNKFSPLTYDATKAWLAQLLDSGETDFLTDFITLVFEKAASEPPFCAIYAKLITELRGDFPHFSTELVRIFNHFITIFEEARDVPDVESAEYAAFLALRERRKYRRGYSAFVGEVAKLGVLNRDDIVRTCNIVLDGLCAAKVQEGQQLLCEEFAECLTTLMKSSKSILGGNVSDLVARVQIAKDKTGSPSLTNKARFSLMDICDVFG